MALDPFLSSLDGVSDDRKGDYVDQGEDAGERRYLLDVAKRDGFALENVDGLVSSLEATRSERDAERRKAGEYLTELEGLRKGKERDKGKAADTLEEQRAEMVRVHGEEVAALKESNALLLRSLDGSTLKDEARAALEAAGFKNNVGVMLPHLEAQLKVAGGENGDPRRVVGKRADGGTRLDTNGQPITALALAKGLASDAMFKDLRDGHGASGGGTTADAGGGGSSVDLGGNVRGIPSANSMDLSPEDIQALDDGTAVLID